MSVDIGKGLLNNAENGRFNVAGQARKYHRLILEGDPQIASFLQSIKVPMQNIFSKEWGMYLIATSRAAQ
jgi:hypothetical protein